MRSEELVAVLRSHARSLVIGGLVAILLYFFLLPGFWPEPRATVEIPSEAVLGQDLPVEVRVSSWHSNFQVPSVRFYVDYYAAPAVTPGHTLYPFLLHTEQSRNTWSRWQINRFTWPRTRRYHLVVPIKDLTEKGMLQAGTLQGKIDVELLYIRPIDSPHGGSLFPEYARRTQQSTPFTIHIR